MVICFKDSSNVLGSGEFSFVVKGRFKSKMKDVAVKIAKPSADVTLFKSLLSEVKIMIYIGWFLIRHCLLLEIYLNFKNIVVFRKTQQYCCPYRSLHSRHPK